MSLRTKEKWTAIGSKAYKAGLQRVVVDGHIRVTLSLNRLTRRQCQIAERRRVTWWKGERRWKMLTFHLIIPSAIPNVIHFSWQVPSISLPASPLHALSRFKSRLYLFVIVFYAGHPLMDANRIYTHPYCVYTLYFFYFFLASVDNELDCFQWVVKEEMDGRRASLSLQPSQTRRWFGWGGEKKNYWFPSNNTGLTGRSVSGSTEFSSSFQLLPCAKPPVTSRLCTTSKVRKPWRVFALPNDQYLQ